MPNWRNQWGDQWPVHAPNVADLFDKAVRDMWQLEDDYVPIEPEKGVQPNDAAEQVRGSIKIEPVPDRTLVFAVVIDVQDFRANTGKFVPCQQGNAIGGYAHDRERDAVLVDAVEVSQLGHVPIAFDATMPSAGPWRIPVPMPEQVVEQSIGGQYRRRLQAMREKYPAPKYRIDFVQLRGCN